jgi:chromatin remodeling complex protein RSC6
MVRLSKAPVTATATPAATAPVAEKAAKAPKSTTDKKEKKVKTVVEASVAPVAPVDAPTNEVVESSDSLSSKMNEFGAKLQQALTIFSSLKVEFKVLEKSVSREMKAAQKSSKKSKRSGNRAPSGFVKPTRISDELASFLGKTSGTEMARTEVSKEINAYIHANKLQDKDNGRKIIPDSKLRTLLKIQADDELTYFNLQRFMKHHFIKTEAVATA